MEAEKELAHIRKIPVEQLFRPRWKGPDVPRKRVYKGHELFKEHMKGAK